jgi:hypothetical protein
MPAYLMEQLARYQREEIRRKAERAHIRSNQRDSIYRRSPRLWLRGLRFKLRKTGRPVEIDLRDPSSLRRPSAQDWCCTSQANQSTYQAPGPQPDPLRSASALR